MTHGDIAVDAILVVGAVGGERRDRATHLIEQRHNLRAVIDIGGSRCRRRDPPGVGVHGDVQLTPRPPGLRAVLLEGQIRSRLSARRLNVVWSGTARSRPSRAMMEPINPSVCRSARRNTDRSVSAVAMARAE